ncbi:MAG: LuxR family transcriptional regulator [Alphaproteobacteria bacterium]|nr:LuxR family transcriptional regulator [Alphaproteobacteria bacterium]
MSDFIEKSNNAKTIEELFKCFENALLQYGFDRIVYSMLKKRAGLGNITHPGIIMNYPEGWQKHYFENSFDQIDPVTQYVLRSGTPFTWDSLKVHCDLTKDQYMILDQSKEAGFNNGIGIPFHGPYGEVSIMGIASSEKNIDPIPNYLSTLNLLAVQFHNSYMLILTKDKDKEKEKRIHLTPREREILLWCVKGKSTSVIAEILNISEHGVKFHIQNIMKKLDTNSRITAVVKAMRFGLITP